MAEKILVVDDEENIVEFIGRALKQNGYSVVKAYNGDDALNMIEEERPDMVVLDLMLPQMDGWEVCRRAKSSDKLKNIPILILTARNSTEDVVQGLDLGADDYMRKPFPLDELLARVRVLLRRHAPEGSSKVIENEGLKIDTASGEAFLHGAMLDLSPTEFDILTALARRMGHTVGREELLRKIWGYGEGDTRTLDVHMSRLRKKLNDGTYPMLSAQTLRGRGYRLIWEEREDVQRNDA